MKTTPISIASLHGHLTGLAVPRRSRRNRVSRLARVTMVFGLATLSALSTTGMAAAQPWGRPGEYYYRDQRGFSGGGGYRYTAPAAVAIPQESRAFYPSLEPVRVHVSLPADAKLSFNGTQTRQRGTSRDFVSPPIAAGASYSYVLQATWNDNGREVTRSHRLSVRAGDAWKVSMGREGVRVERQD